MSAKKPAGWRSLFRRVGSGYPPTIQVLVSLLLIALPCGVLSDAASTGTTLPLWRMGSLLGLALLALLLFHSVRITNLRLWQQLCVLGLQCGLISAMQAVAPSTVSGYLFLVPVIQAVYLFRVLLWLPVAGVVWLVWGGTAILTTQGWLDWIGANIYAIFLLLAVALAAAVYTYQHRARAQIEGLMQKLQQQYTSAKMALEHASHQATLEERNRLEHTVSGELRLALGHLEQMVSRTISQAQASVNQTQPLLNQTQTYVRETVDTLRAALTTLRPGPGSAPLVAAQQSIVIDIPHNHGLATPNIRRVLEWLPLLFGSLVPFWALIEHHADGVVRVETVVIWAALIGYYIYTQRSSNSAWFHLGIIGQTCSLLAMIALTQSPAMLIGLAMVAGQIALRCSWAQMIAGFTVLQGSVAVVIGLITPALWQTVTSLLLFAIIGTALVVPIIIARRRLNQRTIADRIARQIGDAVVQLHHQAEDLRQQAVVAERHRVAREIHDGIGHYLMTVSLQLHIAQEKLASDPAAALRQLHETQYLLGQAQRHLMHSVDALNPLPDQPQALRAALDELVQSYNQQGGLRVTLLLEGELDNLPEEVNLALFRVAQEGLTNVARHGRASEARLTLTRWPAQVQLLVADNGCGVCGESSGTGFGLLGINERAALLGGWCDSGPGPEGGFVLRFEVPMTEAALL